MTKQCKPWSSNSQNFIKHERLYICLLIFVILHRISDMHTLQETEKSTHFPLIFISSFSSSYSSNSSWWWSWWCCWGWCFKAVDLDASPSPNSTHLALSAYLWLQQSTDSLTRLLIQCQACVCFVAMLLLVGCTGQGPTPWKESTAAKTIANLEAWILPFPGN